MSLQALNSALTGLRAAQQQLNILSNNIANVGTPGYTRKILPQSTQTLSTGQGIGVLTDTVIRKVDITLTRDLWTQVSAVSANEVKAGYLASIEAFNGPPDKELSIAAYIAALKDEFTALADTPNDTFALQSTVNKAIDVAGKFNDYADLINQLRTDAQDEMITSINTINAALDQIANLNTQIKNATSVGRSSADLEDRRDEAIKGLSQEIEITFFKRSDGVMVVQTTTGVELVAEKSSPLSFTPSTITPTAAYPGSVSGVYTNGNSGSASAFDIADSDLGGRLGALLELRDDTLIQYQAQLDEMAYQLAVRFDLQGLALYTDGTGLIPANTPPDPSVPTPVEYVGFASNIRVNPLVINDVSLLQSGTYVSDKDISAGSNEVIRRVLEFTFGTVHYQEAEGDIDLRVAAPATDLQGWLGLYSQNNVIGNLNLASYPEIDDGDTATTNDLAGALSSYFPNWPDDDQFQITFEDARTGLATTMVTIDLSTAAAQAGAGIDDALDQLIEEINDQIAAAAVPAGFAAVASRNANGQLVISSRGNITIDSTFAGGMGTSALAAIGLAEGTYNTEDPYFDVQIGNSDPVRITIEPGDDENDLIDKLRWDAGTQTGVYGLLVDFDTATGFLTLRPGIDASNGGPSFGGDMRITGGPFTTNNATNGTLAALPEEIGIVSALFGSYSVSGGDVTELSATSNIGYASETRAGSGVYVSYRTQFLGQQANVSTAILAATSIIDFSQKVVNKQTQDLVNTENVASDNTTLRDLLQRRLTDESGVNIDEELSNLIIVQTAYAASARAVSAADEMFTELLNSIF